MHPPILAWILFQKIVTNHLLRGISAIRVVLGTGQGRALGEISPLTEFSGSAPAL